MTTTNFSPTFSNDSDSDLISQKSHSRRNGMEKEVEKIRDFFYLPDLTLLEKKMLEDWIDFVSSLSPPDYAEQWLGIQGTIRKILAQKKNQGENLETFKQTKSGQDPQRPACIGTHDVPYLRLEDLGNTANPSYRKIAICCVAIALELASS